MRITFLADDDVGQRIEFLRSCDVVVSRVINKALRKYFSELVEVDGLKKTPTGNKLLVVKR